MRPLASRLGGGGAGGGGGEQCDAQPRCWAVAIVLLAVGGGWCAVQPRGWAAAAPMSAVEHDTPIRPHGLVAASLPLAEGDDRRIVWP